MKRMFKYYPEDFKDLPVKVIHMDLVFDVYDTYTNVKSKLRIKSLKLPLSKIELNAKNLEILSIYVDNRETSYEYRKDENIIIINFQNPVPPDTEFVINTETICKPTKNILEGLYYDEIIARNDSQLTRFFFDLSSTNLRTSILSLAELLRYREKAVSLSVAESDLSSCSLIILWMSCVSIVDNKDSARFFTCKNVPESPQNQNQKEEFALRKPVVLLLAVLSLFTFALSAYAGEIPEPYTQDGVSMMPLRLVAEANGAQVIWDADGAAVVIREVVTRPAVVDEITGAVISPAEKGTLAARFVPDSDVVMINGVPVTMPLPATLNDDGRLYVPAQMVSLLFAN